SNAAKCVRWLSENGAVLTELDTSAGILPQVALMPLGAVQTSALLGTGGDLLLQEMGRRLLDGNGRFLLSHRPVDLICKFGGVAGVKAQGPNGPVEIPADGVVIADGGFQGDPELVEKYIGAKPGSYVQRGAGTGSGVGLSLAAVAGAQLVNLDSFYGHLL